MQVKEMLFLMESKRYGKGTVRYRYPSEKGVESRGGLNSERILNDVKREEVELTKWIGVLTNRNTNYLE